MAGGIVVLSGAPCTGKSTVATTLADGLHLPQLSLEQIKEALADVLGLGDEAWFDRVAGAAAEVVFRLARSLPGAVAEGWWRRAWALGAKTGRARPKRSWPEL